MRTHIGQKVSFNLPDGRSIDGIVISDVETVPTTVRNRTSGALVDIAVTRVSVLSQRESLEGVVYKTITDEVVNYGYSPKMTPRFNSIAGLDADENGEAITLQANIDTVKADRESFLKGLFDARHEVVAADAV